MSLEPGDGSKSAIHFNAINDANMTLYSASPTGKPPGGSTVYAHGDVTSHAIRMRLDNNPKCGFIVENNLNKGVFSVSQQGNTRMASGKIADLVPDIVTSFAHHKHHDKLNYAILQNVDGKTSVNSAKGQPLELRNNNVAVAYVEGSTFNIVNPKETNRTHFNYDGSNYIVAGDNGKTVFRFAQSNHPTAEINKTGLFVHGLDVHAEITALKEKVKKLEANQANFVNKTKRVYLKNGRSGKYLRSHH